MSARTLLLAGVAAIGLTASAHATVFDLGTVASGSTLPLTITAGGTTASFTSTTGNQFVTQPTFGLLNFDPGLMDQAATDHPLTISFSAPVTGIVTIPFVVFDNNFTDTQTTLTATVNGGTPLTFTAYESNFGAFLQNTLQIVASTPISSLVLSNPDYSIGIGSINVAAPEPASLGVLAFGLAGAVTLRRRRARV